jgi:acyl dehydratase
MSIDIEVRVGDELPPFVREGSVAHWNRFAAVNCEFAPHHWDYDVAKNEGFTAPFAMAPLQLAFFHAMLRDWMGDSGRIVSVSAKLRGPFFKDQTLTAAATVTALQPQGGETYVDLALTQIDQTGRSIAVGTAQLALTMAPGTSGPER